MTIPYMMNCDHSGDGWCLACVKAMGEENARIAAELSDAVRQRDLLHECSMKWRKAAFRWMSEVVAEQGLNQRQIAQTYGMAIHANKVHGEPVDWKVINEAIVKRWSERGLEHIKKLAWSGKCFEKKERSWPLLPL